MVSDFPQSVRIDIGNELYWLQLGEQALHSKPFASVGRGVWEIRVKDGSGAFRVFCIVRRRDGVHVLHAFQKQTRKTRKADIEIGRSRYRELQRKK
ncbi:MAG: type II toxin-antitoxin system RelE/ParE family toxin [Gammaproteobacteria bacterium]|nr:type II toxin-antitoxin system RelE/ParE family toxin [Gammaproteobacteria bacterium]